MQQSVKRILEKTLNKQPDALQIILANHEKIGSEHAKVVLQVHDNRLLINLAQGNIGAIASAVVEGHADLYGPMREVMAVAADLLPQAPIHNHASWWQDILHYTHSLSHHTLSKDAAQIQFHYDISDEFYALWLDSKRIYSCAYYADDTMNLEQAQSAKLDLICRKLNLQNGERLLDIGCGWGGLLIYAAEHYGVYGTGITLSHHQFAYAKKLIQQRGLQERVRIHFCDYRQFDDDLAYDKLASIGMFEHVGKANMDAYFATLKLLVKPGGMILNHGISAGGTGNNKLGGGMGEFIGQYIFPGGELMHIGEVLSHATRAGLESVDIENLRPHYAKTLWAWSDALENQLFEAQRILEQSMDAQAARRTLKAYRLYLAGCAMGFEQGWISLYQSLITHPNGDITSGRLRGAQSDYPFKRDFIYAAD